MKPNQKPHSKEERFSFRGTIVQTRNPPYTVSRDHPIIKVFENENLIASSPKVFPGTSTFVIAGGLLRNVKYFVHFTSENDQDWEEVRDFIINASDPTLERDFRVDGPEAGW